MVVATKDKVEGELIIGGVRRKGNQLVIDVEKTLNLNMLSAMEKIGYQLVDELDKNAPESSGALKGSFDLDQVRETKTGYRIEISVGKDYADFVDKGVRGIKHSIKNKITLPNNKGEFYQYRKYGMPLEALKSLEGWAKRRNIEIEATNLRIKYGDDTLKDNTYLPEISQTAKQLAYFIKKNGIAASNYQGKSIDSIRPKLTSMAQAIGFNSITLKVSK